LKADHTANLDKINKTVDDLLQKYIPEQKNRPVIEIADGVDYLGKTTWVDNDENNPVTTITINKEILENEDILRQTLAHEIIHHHLYQNYGNKVSKHGEHFNMYADRINAKEGENFISQFADNTDFIPNGDSDSK